MINFLMCLRTSFFVHIQWLFPLSKKTRGSNLNTGEVNSLLQKQRRTNKKNIAVQKVYKKTDFTRF